MRKFKYLFTLMSACLLASCGANTQEPSSSSSSLTNSEQAYSVPTYEEESVQIHYKRKDGKYDNWALWLWKIPDGTGKEYQFNGRDSYGAVASYPLSTFGDVKSSGLGFIVKTKGSWNQKDPDGDRTILFSKFDKDEHDVYHVYLQSGDATIYSNDKLEVIDEITTAKFENFTRILIGTNVAMSSCKIYEDNELIADETFTTPQKTYRFKFPSGKEAQFGKSYRVSCTFEKSKKTLEASISQSSLYKTTAFNNMYSFDGQLGAIYSKESTTFNVWSPVSTSIKLRIYNNGTPKAVDTNKGSDEIYKEVEMTRGEKGVFSATINEDLQGKYYTFVVSNSSYKNKETVDPYAFSTGVNGARGMIVDFSKTNPVGFETMNIHSYDRKHLTVYETHIADITSSETWTNDASLKKYAKTFKGAYTSGTTYTKDGVTVKTGFDHIKELGVNAVQLIPVFDQANDELNMTFNWGYNPANYNTLEGGYSSNPHDGYARIKEFKELVKAYNENGMNIIMDVVYNHMNGAVGSPFDILMPEYYFRYTSTGGLSNGSGCGNETASEMPMMRKFMIDSTLFLAKEYKLGGFRFDLMGLHDLDTMEEISAKLKELNPNIVVYGEPWSGGTSTLIDANSAKQLNMDDYVGYGAFNDKMRDALIKGGLNATSAKGWVSNNTTAPSSSDLTAIASGVKGQVNSTNDPDKVVNYVTCHDNYTLDDRFKAAGITSSETRKKMAMLANSVVFTSNGTTFMLAGEEFLRTKGGNSNSYDASYKVNELDYSLKIKNMDMFENYKKLISLKQNVSGLALAKGSNNVLKADTSKGNVISYSFNDVSTGRNYIVYHCNGYNSSALPKVNLEGYNLYLSTTNNTKSLSSATQLEAYETLIAYK